MLQLKIVSSLEKAFPDSIPENFAGITKLSMYRNERLSFQVLYRDRDPAATYRKWMRPVLTGGLEDYAQIRTVECVPSVMPVYPGRFDDNFLRTEPGLFPDVLQPLHCDGNAPVAVNHLRSLWIDIDPCGAAAAGDYSLKLAFMCGEDTMGEVGLTVHIIDAFLPEQTMYVTQWFHCDCLADWYHVEVFSERHWEIIENYVRVAVKNGINMLLTPVFTPPLDTAVGRERPTVQLVGVTKGTAADDYTFDFTLLDRWVEMCDRNGIKFFEISHLFTQWGAAHAPKIIAAVDGEQKKIFGWETEISGPDCEYAVFLRKFLGAFISHMKEKGNDGRCFYHISDEPSDKYLEQYEISRNTVADILKDYATMDALSSYEFYSRGLVKMPVVANTHMMPFIEHKVPQLWTYYCCGQSIGASNRFLAMPGARTRYLGTQCYKYNITGFLQWGYNFYYNQGSYDLVNPFLDTTGEYFFPSGDGYSVYPAADGTALESMRIIQFYEGLADLGAMRLCESYYGHEATVGAIESVIGRVKFDRCPYRSEEMLEVRRKIDSMVESALDIRK